MQAGTGNLTADPEVTTTDKGATKVRCAVANTPRWRDRSGDYQEGTTVFTRLEWWGKEARAFADGAAQGDPVVWLGDMRASEWTDGEGQKRHRQWVAAERIGLVARPRKRTQEAETDDSAGEAVEDFLQDEDDS